MWEGKGRHRFSSVRVNQSVPENPEMVRVQEMGTV